MYRALLAMLSSQAAVALAAFALPVVAPAAALSLGVPATQVGYHTTVLLAGAMAVTTVTAGFVRRHGALRVSQATLAFSALGLAILPLANLAGAAWPFAGPLLLVLSALALGCALGPANPASSHLLARVTPDHLRARVFSIKQTCIPLGAAAGGFMLPLLEARYGWQGAALAAAGVCLALLLALQGWRARLDDDRVPDAPLLGGGLLRPVRTVFGEPALRRLALASGAFAAMQFAFLSLFVSFAVERTGLSLVAIGGALSAGLTVSIGARVFWGWVADRTVPRLVLAGLGLAMAAAALATAALGPAWPYAGVVLLAVAFGCTATSWQGVYLAEVARHAPPGKVADATAGTMAVTFLGGLTGPGAFSALALATGNDAAGFLAIGAATAAFGLAFLRPMHAERGAARAGRPETRWTR